MVTCPKLIVETFLEESGLNDRIKMGDEKARILEAILRTRCSNWTRVKQAETFHISIRTVDNYIKELRDLYTETQKNSIILPKPQIDSKSELELDKE